MPHKLLESSVWRLEQQSLLHLLHPCYLAFQHSCFTLFKLHSEGDQLLATEHPGRNSIEVREPRGGTLASGWSPGDSALGYLHSGRPQGPVSSVCLSTLPSPFPLSGPASSSMPRPLVPRLLKPMCCLHYFPIVAVRNDCQLGGFKQWKVILS